jgi:hypothetical protein
VDLKGFEQASTVTASSWSEFESCSVLPTVTSEPLAGVQILASLDSKWTPRDLFRDVEARKHFRKSMFWWT